MATTTLVALVLLSVAYSWAQIQVRTECPSLSQFGVGVCLVQTCTEHAECPINQWCCPNSCGANICTVVSASCFIDGSHYNHHQHVQSIHNVADNRCAECWCQNGRRACEYFDCNGPIPMIERV